MIQYHFIHYVNLYLFIYFHILLFRLKSRDDLMVDECRREYSDFRHHFVRYPDFEKARFAWKRVSYCYNEFTTMQKLHLLSIMSRPPGEGAFGKGN